MTASFAPTQQRAFTYVTAATALAAAGLLSVRTDAAMSQSVALATFFAILITHLPAARSTRRLIAVTCLGIAAVLVIAVIALDVDQGIAIPASLLALMISILAGFHRTESVALVTGAAIACFLVLVALAWRGENHVSPATSVLAAGLAAFSAGRSVAPGPEFDIRQAPAASCFMAGSATLIAAAVSNREIWLVIAILLVGTGVMLDNGQDTNPAIHILTYSLATTVSISFLAGAAALAAGSFSGGSFGWALVGATAVGLTGLVAVVFGFADSAAAREVRLRHALLNSQTDPLTNLFNRREIDRRLDQEIARARRFDHSLSVIMIDVDDFKSINDRLGHASGDIALAAVARTIESSIRSIDVAGRFGGEEFLIVLPETSLAGAQVVAERIRASLDSQGALTLSAGVAELSGAETNRPLLVHRADQALYTAKRSGKNQVALAD